MESLIENSTILQKQALNVIKSMDLDNITASIGKLNLVGSVAYNLMTWRDIDFDLITPTVPTNEFYWKLVPKIFAITGVRKLTLVDNRDNTDAGRPKSMYIGVAYADQIDQIWKLDIRLLSQEAITTTSTDKLVNENITDEKRLYILDIKTKVHDNPQYHKGFSSVDIYNAVLLNGVKTLKEFGCYLNTLGKSL